ncbi:MAG: citramalate synthase [Alphaproteobacteria bacterium]
MTERLYIYDTTLRDGAQMEGVDFTAADKVAITLMLDRLGIDYIEGGWPGANPTDDAFFEKPPALERAKLCAFGMTRRAGRSAANDPVLAPLFQATADVITLVGKTSAGQVEKALGASLDENLRMIADSLAEAKKRASEVMLDAEHFFDGFAADPGYALACLEAAIGAGARWVVLCDTNGGRLPHEVATAVEKVLTVVPSEKLGIHTHNDTENAVANSLAAVEAGARQVQGTLNGLGERCGNANLITLLPTLMLKMGYGTGVGEEKLVQLTEISRSIDERLNRNPNHHAAYVGANAFTHKAGLHASAVAKDPSFYEHIQPEKVGNRRTILVSNQAGRSNLMVRLAEVGLGDAATDDQVRDLLGVIKEREANGYAYEGADASFELLARRSFGEIGDFFRLISFRIIDERRFNARNELVTMSEATIKVEVQGETRMIVAEGNGPVNALDSALRQALSPTYPGLEHMHLADYKVRILTPDAGTAAVTRVIIESVDDQAQRWSTVGVSTNVIDASYNALHDAITYKLFLDGEAAARPGSTQAGGVAVFGR